jgi:regulator of protease activity HflC (stomatin/prohibitin superfamily)
LKSSTRGLFIVITALALVFVVVVPSVFTVNAGQTVAVRKLGRIEETVSPGLHFRLWLINDLIRYDLTVRQITFEFSAYSIDAQNVEGEVSIQYTINPNEVIAIANDIGSVHDLEVLLRSIMGREVQNVIASESAMDIVGNRAKLGQDIYNHLNELGGQYHVTVTAVSIMSLKFSVTFNDAVEQRMVAEQEMRRAEFERDRALVVANQERQVAEILAEAILVRAQADARALEVMQAAWGDLADTVKDAMLRQQFFETWNGELPTVLGGGGELGLIMNGIGLH